MRQVGGRTSLAAAIPSVDWIRSVVTWMGLHGVRLAHRGRPVWAYVCPWVMAIMQRVNSVLVLDPTLRSAWDTRWAIDERKEPR